MNSTNSLSVLNSNFIRTLKVKLQLQLLSPNNNVLRKFSKCRATEIVQVPRVWTFLSPATVKFTKSNKKQLIHDRCAYHCPKGRRLRPLLLSAVFSVSFHCQTALLLCASKRPQPCTWLCREYHVLSSCISTNFRFISYSLCTICSLSLYFVWLACPVAERSPSAFAHCRPDHVKPRKSMRCRSLGYSVRSGRRL